MHRRLGLWTGLVGAPVVWLVTSDLDQGLAPWACASDLHGVLHLLAVVAIAGAGLLAWRWGSREDRPAHEAGGARSAHLLGLGGLGSSGVVALVVLATQIPMLVASACE